MKLIPEIKQETVTVCATEFTFDCKKKKCCKKYKKAGINCKKCPKI